jgi:hypothetical protein
MEACKELGMPLVLQEYNIKKAYPKERKEQLKEVSKASHQCKGNDNLITLIHFQVSVVSEPISAHRGTAVAALHLLHVTSIEAPLLFLKTHFSSVLDLN